MPGKWEGEAGPKRGVEHFLSGPHSGRDQGGIGALLRRRPVRLGRIDRHKGFEVFFHVLSTILGNGVSVVAAAALIKGWSEPDLQPLGEIAQCRVLHCQTDPETAERRFAGRVTDSYGRISPPDHEVLTQMQAGIFHWDRYDPLDLPWPTLVLDTTALDVVPTLDEVLGFVLR